MSYGKIFKYDVENGIGIATFNVVGDAMNTWNDEAIREFYGLLDALEKKQDIKGLIFISGKSNNFHAGANLKMMEGVQSKKDVTAMTSVFHKAFLRIGQLPFPTLAAIDGHCLGGGLEFALACTARIAKDSKTTIIGLPEVNVGLFPGAGGTQRLPRLIGYSAFDLILKGSMLPAAKAYDLGIVDRLISGDKDLKNEAISFVEEINSGKVILRRPEHDFTQIDQLVDQARRDVLASTKGRELPGPMLAIKAMQAGLKVNLEEALKIEEKYFADVATSNEAKGSINTFFIKTMTDKPQNMMSKGFKPKLINQIAILGFGFMGRGIAIDILRNTRLTVIAKDIPQALEPGREFIRKILNGMFEKKRLKEPVNEIMNRLIVTSEFNGEFKNTDLVIEVVFENMDLKREVYKSISNIVNENCLIASNTSSLSINKLAECVINPERFGGTHFFSPVWMMQLLEVVRGEKTSQETIDNLLNFASMIRKRPIVCKDNPGFVVNALVLPYLRNAYDFIEKGNTIEKVDNAMKIFGMPVGPIRLTDEVGIDVPYKVMVGMGIEQETLKNIVTSGRLGLKKAGKGIFMKDGSVDPEVLPLIAKKERLDMTEDDIQKTMLKAMVIAGKDLLDRNIVDDPRMIDVGMIWGTGFPADKGGPMKWADLIGLSKDLFGKNFY